MFWFIHSGYFGSLLNKIEKAIRVYNNLQFIFYKVTSNLIGYPQCIWYREGYRVSVGLEPCVQVPCHNTDRLSVRKGSVVILWSLSPATYTPL